jgi:hypothetical protein
MSKQAVKYARKTQQTTIWDVWPCHLYNHRNESSNALRCIHNDKTTRQQFYENMSRAFAIKAHGAVEVMHGSEDYEAPPMDGIWGRVEFPTILHREKVYQVRCSLHD